MNDIRAKSVNRGAQPPYKFRTDRRMCQFTKGPDAGNTHFVNFLILTGFCKTSLMADHINVMAVFRLGDSKITNKIFDPPRLGRVIFGDMQYVQRIDISFLR